MFPHPCRYASDFNCCHADKGYDDNSPNDKCLAGWASINCLARLHNAKDAARFYSGRWNTGNSPDPAFASVGPNNRLPDRHVLQNFPRSQHRFVYFLCYFIFNNLCLLHHQGLLCHYQASLLSNRTSARSNEIITLL